MPAFQDLMPNNPCFGCGPTNDGGLRIKSHWDGPNESVCSFAPQAHQNAGPRQFLNGGIIATVIDCHCICTAIADAYRRQEREIGSAPNIWYVTGLLSVTYRRPASITAPVEVRARIDEVGERKTRLSCSLFSDGSECVEASVVAVSVASSWWEVE